eukprot:jgi/Mesvir1/13397/Mv16486-RA.1
MGGNIDVALDVDGGSHFRGEVADCRAARERVRLPIPRKQVTLHDVGRQWRKATISSSGKQFRWQDDASSNRSSRQVIGMTPPETAAEPSDVGTGHVRKSLKDTPLAFATLKPDDFRHPLDKQNTQLLRMLPGLEVVGKNLLSPVAEQLMILENIGTSVKVGENQMPAVHRLLVEAACILGIPLPDLYVRQDPTPNAYTLAIAGRKPFIVVTTSLVELLTLAELQTVIAHEMGHLVCDHGVWLTFANIIALGAISLPGFGALIANNLEEQLLRWLRAAELTCDRAALLVAQNPKVVISVLMKLAGGCPSLANELNVDAFLQQARSYDEASSSPLGWYLRNAHTRQLSHPLPVMRAREIDAWSRGEQYQGILRTGRPIRPETQAVNETNQIKMVEGKCGVLMKKLEAITAHTEALAMQVPKIAAVADGHHRILGSHAPRQDAGDLPPLSYADLLRSATTSTTDAIAMKLQELEEHRQAHAATGGHGPRSPREPSAWCCVVCPRSQVGDVNLPC